MFEIEKGREKQKNAHTLLTIKIYIFFLLSQPFILQRR